MAKRVSTSKEECEHEQLCRMIQRWNENRVEIFEITMPNENLEFEGVMRFYYQGSNADGNKVATKCMRVPNTASTMKVVEELIQKFCLESHTPSSFTLYEVHSHTERKLEKEDRPLMVQLNWVKGDREGRFLLRQEQALPLSKAEKKALKDQAKKEKKSSRKKRSRKGDVGGSVDDILEASKEEKESGTIARSLYQDMPESQFTRSIFMKGKRSQTFKGDRRRLSLPGDETDVNATVNIYADAVLPDVPCKSLLISSSDTAAQVVRSVLDKYGLREDPHHFCLAQVIIPPSSLVGSDPHLNLSFSEHVLEDAECPLLVMNENAQLHLRRRARFAHRSHSLSVADDLTLPALIEVFQGAQSPPQSPRRFPLSLEATEIGSNVALLDSKSYICLTSPGIRPRHCVISSIQDLFTISPLSKQAVIYVNNKFVKEPQFLPHSAVIRLGDREIFRFFAPAEMKQSSTSVHTLPTNIGRLGSSTGVGDLSRKHDSGLPLRGEAISKAFSVEDILNSPALPEVVGRKLKGRAVSEYNLKAEEEFGGEEGGCQDRKYSDPAFALPEVPAKLGSKHVDPHSVSPTKRRLYSLPQVGESELKLQDWALPAAVSFYQAKETLLLQSMVSEVNGYLLQFKLAPAYALYMVVKHHLTPEFQPGMSSFERQKCLVLTIKAIVSQIKRAVKESRNVAGALVFWLANTSELLNFLRKDHQLARFLEDCDAPLSHIIHTAYRQFTKCMENELDVFLPAFFDESPEADCEEGYVSGGEASGIGNEPDVVPVVRTPGVSRQSSITGMYWSVAGSKIRRRGRATIGDVLMTLSSTVSLLKRCRVNATLSVMTFAILFRYMSSKLFNKLVTEGKRCSRSVGQKLRTRLERVRVWAEKEGMELPAETHLSVIVQAANLLQAVKKHPDDVQSVYATCPKLNSHQVAALLHNCSMLDGDVAVNQGFVEGMIILAQGRTDQLLLNEGIEVKLEENPNLELRFVVPSVGYSCDTIQGLPPGLKDFLDPMISAGLCKLLVNKDSSGYWSAPGHVTTSMQSLDRSISPYTLGANTVSASNTLPRTVGHSQFQRPMDSEFRGSSTLPRRSDQLPDLKVVRVTLTKEQNSLGISIIGAKSPVTHDDLGVFVKSMGEGGAAYQDGRLQPGDQILSVDNYSLEGCTQEQAAHTLRSTAKTVCLTVAKQAAMYYGLTDILRQPSPRHGRKQHPAPISEGSSHARKAMRRQKRERERERQRQQYEFKLERRKPLEQPQVEFNHYPPPPPSFVSSSTTTMSNLTEGRFPLNANPQFAKWIMEHNFHYNPEKESELNIQGSMSSLTNIPERDIAASPVTSHTAVSTRPREDSSDIGGFYHPPSPPVRDSGPSRPSEYNSSCSNFEGMEHVSRTDSDAPSKFSEYTSSEPDHHFIPIPNAGSVVPPHLLPSSSASITPYANNFSSVSSQPTLSSQQMLTPYSQQHPGVQGNSQLLDRLSMDVMQHTQHTGSYGDGITSLVPKLAPAKPRNSPHPLERSDLQELEMDEIDLIKQRLQLMYYSQQKQGQDHVNPQQDDGPQMSAAIPTKGTSDGQSGFQSRVATSPNHLAHKDDHSRVLAVDEDDDVFPEHGERPTLSLQLRQELESLEQMVCDQKRRCKEIKMAKEREELKLRQREHELMSSSGMLGVNPRDQHRWQREQKRRLRELEKVRSEQSEQLQQFECEEHRARSKLKAFEAQAIELREQIEKAESSASAAVLRPSPTGGYSPVESQVQPPDLYQTASHYTDTVPSKLPSSSDRRGTRVVIGEDKVHATTSVFSSDHIAPAELEWAESTSKPSRVMSFESMATSTRTANEQPDIAKEVATTMSLSTEPTQDEPLLPPPSNWAVYDSSDDSPPSTSDIQSVPMVQGTNPFHSKTTLTEDQLSRDKKLKQLREEHLRMTITEDRRVGGGSALLNPEGSDVHTTRGQREKQSYYELQQRKVSGPQSHKMELRVKHGENLPAVARNEHTTQLPVSWTTEPSRHQTIAPRIHPQHVPHQHTWIDSHGMQPYERYQHRVSPQGVQRTRPNLPYPPRSPHDHTGNPVRNEVLVAQSGGALPHPGTDRHIPPPDVVPTALGVVSPHSVHRKVSAERSASPSTTVKYSDVHSSSVTPTRSYSPHQRGVSPQGNPHSFHPPPTSSLPLQEHYVASTTMKSPTDRPKAVSAFTSPRYLPLSGRSPLSASRPVQPPASTGKVSLGRTHDFSTTTASGTSYENTKPQNTPERDTSLRHHTPTSAPSSPPRSTHRYGVTRPENKAVGRSYSRGRPDTVSHPMNYDGRHKVNAYRDQPHPPYQGSTRHPERIHRQQTEL